MGESMRAAVRNAGDEDQVRSARRREELADRVAVSDLRDLLKLPGFRRHVMRTLGFCGIYRTPFDDDERRTVHNIGRGDVGRYLIAELERVDPEAYVRMLQEVKQLESTERRVAADTDTTEDANVS